MDETTHIPVVENGLTHGYTLTKFGILVNSPWEYSSEFRNGVYVLDGLNNKETSDYELVTFTNNEKELVFQLLKKGKLKYWLKKDYLDSSFSKLRFQNESKPNDISGAIEELKNFKIENHVSKVYNSGHWEANFIDSTISIEFGDAKLGLKPIKGKYKVLTPDLIEIEETDIFEEKNNEKKEIVKKKKRFSLAPHTFRFH